MWHAVTNSFLDITRELIHVNMDSTVIPKINNPWGRKVWKSYTGLAFYRGMPVAVKQFNERVSQAEVEHEANVTLFPHLIRPNLSCLYYNSNSFFGRNDSTDFYDFLTVFGKIWF